MKMDVNRIYLTLGLRDVMRKVSNNSRTPTCSLRESNESAEKNAVGRKRSLNGRLALLNPEQPPNPRALQTT